MTDLKQFSEEQRQALLDLAMLAMYADGHLAVAEDDRVIRLLSAMGFHTDYDRAKHYDASISRVSRHAVNAASARSHALTLAHSFHSREQRQAVHDILTDLIRSDQRVAPQEGNFLSLVKEALNA